jgi:hypothetical protein
MPGAPTLGLLRRARGYVDRDIEAGPTRTDYTGPKLYDIAHVDRT